MTNNTRNNRKKPKERKKKVATESYEPSIAATSNTEDASIQFGEPSLEPKHKMFLSHSGKDKDFTWQLCEDLVRIHHFPFFDKRSDSLPKGELFPPLIKKAARQCRVAILVLSEEFFTLSKWPMIELNEFVKAQEMPNGRLKILPLFLGLTMSEYNEKTRQQGWVRRWREMAREDERINVEEWQHSLSKIPGGINAMEYAGVSEGYVSFRKKVVAAVCQLLPPDVEWDVSHVQSMESLCMKEVIPNIKYGVRVVGIYGMGGVGKTTISQAVCNHMVGDFDGKVCHVEFGGPNLVELMRRVLQELTEASSNILDQPAGKLVNLLKVRMCRQKVFLVLDNVWERQIDDVLKYLEAGYHKDSILLVTARSLDILVKLLQIPESDCLKMPELDDIGAFDVFIHYTRRSGASLCEDDQRIVWKCVKSCGFRNLQIYGSTYHYLPLALKALGSHLGAKYQDVSRWEHALRRLHHVNFNKFKNEVHPVYSVLRSGYDALGHDEQRIFLDMALILKSKFQSKFQSKCHLEWLCAMHMKTKDDIEESLFELREKGILEAFSVDDYGILFFRIHDLYLDFAQYEAERVPVEKRRFLLDENGSEVPHVLMRSDFCSNLERLVIRNSKVRSLSNAMLHNCSNVEVLVLAQCRALEEIDVTGMTNMKIIDFDECHNLGLGVIKGIMKLDKLIRLEFKLFKKHELEFIQGLPSLTELQYLSVHSIDYPLLDFSALNLSGCKKMRVLAFFRVDMGSILLESMSTLTNLENLTLNARSSDWTFLGELIPLQQLTVSSNFFELPDLGKLKKLWYLNVQGCTSLVGTAHATALRELHAFGCDVLSELPDDWSSLSHLKKVHIEYCSSITTLPIDYERLVARDILEVGGCWLLIVPLVKELEQQMLVVSNVKEYGESDGCVSCCGRSTQSSINAMKDVGCAAYDLLKNVWLSFDLAHWTYMLNEGETFDFFVIALCEHLAKGGPERLRSLVLEITRELDDDHHTPWVVVATAPCTFGMVTERAMLVPEPSKTFLEYLIDDIFHGSLDFEERPFTKLGIDELVSNYENLRQIEIDQGINFEQGIGDEYWDLTFQKMEAMYGLTNPFF